MPPSQSALNLPSWITASGAPSGTLREPPRALYPNLPIPTRALLEQFDIPLQRTSIPEPTDPQILAEERKMTDFNQAFRICLRYIGIDPTDWDNHFTIFKKRQQEENKLIINKDHEAMMILEDNLTEAIRAEMPKRYKVRSRR